MDAGEYLLAYLLEMDFCCRGEMGMSPLSFLELSAWQASTGLQLSPWEILSLKRLSSEYVDQLHRSRDPHEPAPYQIDDQPRQREAVQNFFMDFAKRHNANVRPRNSRSKGHVQRD